MIKLLIAIFMLSLGVSLSYSQTSILKKTVDIDVKNTSIKEILQQVSKQTNCFFTYNPEFISENKKITYNTINASIASVLSDIIPREDITYSVIDDHIVICTKKTNFLISKKTKTDSLNYFIISGRVNSKKNNKAIPFASIGILNTTIGTVSNENGFFSFKIDKIYSDSSIYIANLAYETLYVPIKSLKKNILDFILTENVVSIQEVIIKANDPNVIINNVIENIKNNYPQKTTVLSAFYREGVKKRSKILNFSEAIIKIRKSPYKTSFVIDKIKVEKSRKIINVNKTDTLFIKLKDGLYTTLELDIIKKQPSFFKLDANLYKYRTVDIVTFGDKFAYVVSFEQKPNVDDALYKGKIYIETETYAILAAEYELNLKASINKPNFVVKKKRKFRIKATKAKYYIAFRNIGNKYFLSHVRANVVFKVKKKRNLFSAKYSTFLETVVFDIDTINTKKFHNKELEKKDKIFIDNHYSYDPDFWGENNFIKPEKSIEDALSKIIAKLNYIE